MLKPVHIDRYNGYRYYKLRQLTRLNRILALKDLGFSLEQIIQLIDENLTTAEMRGMLRMKQMELADTVTAEQARLARVEIRLRQLEQEGHLPMREVAIKSVPKQTVLSAEAVAAREDAILPARQSLQVMLQNFLHHARLKPCGPWFALVNDLPYIETDLEVALAVEINLKPGGRSGDWEGTPVRMRNLPAEASMASVIHEGAYTSLTGAYTSLYAWTQSNGFQVAGQCREIYLHETGVSAQQINTESDTLIEVQCPVKRASIPISIYSPKTVQEDKIMQPEIKPLPTFTVVGMPYVGKNEHGEIPQMWGEFIPRMGEIKGIGANVCYGACFAYAEGAAESEFEYVACLEVEDKDNIPQGMVLREVPEYKYAVFTHHGKIDKLPETYQYIYQTWFPQSNLETDGKFDMEYYDEDFIHDSDDSKLYIYVAIK